VAQLDLAADGVILKRYINLGIAVSIPDG